MRLAVLPLAFFIATPAAAQTGISGIPQASASQRERGVSNGPHGGWSGELRRIERRADDAREAGEISRGEARSIRRQAGAIRALGFRYAASGLTEAELDVLESQVFALRDLAQAPGRPVPPPRRRGR